MVLTPALLAALGFTATGIASGSIAAKMMSLFALFYGGGIPAGGLVATLQSIGKYRVLEVFFLSAQTLVTLQSWIKMQPSQKRNKKTYGNSRKNVSFYFLMDFITPPMDAFFTCLQSLED